MSRVNEFRTDYWYGLEVHTAKIFPEARLGSYRDRVELVFNVTEPGLADDFDSPRACISFSLGSDGKPVGWSSDLLLNVLDVPLPIAPTCDGMSALLGRRAEGQIRASPAGRHLESVETGATCHFRGTVEDRSSGRPRLPGNASRRAEVGSTRGPD